MTHSLRDLYDKAHDALVAFADYEQTVLSNSPIGYPNKSPEQAIRTGRPPGPLVPDVMSPERIRATDRALQLIPPELKAAIVVKYFIPGKDIDKAVIYRRRTGKGRTHYDAMLRQGWVYIGALL